jgi:choline kinase
MIKCNDKEVLFMSEKMTKNELEQLRKLQAKQQRIRRHEKEFWKEVDNRLDEIMKRYNLIDNDVIDNDIVSPDKLPKF